MIDNLITATPVLWILFQGLMVLIFSSALSVPVIKYVENKTKSWRIKRNGSYKNKPDSIANVAVSCSGI